VVLKYFKFLFALSELLGAIFIRRIFCFHSESSHTLSFPATTRAVSMLKVARYRNLFILKESLFYRSYDGKAVQKKVIKPLLKSVDFIS
jgi:hypothetical protein